MLIRVGAGFVLFFGSMAGGWWLRRRGLMPEARASALVRFVVTVTSPAVLCFSFWRMPLRHREPWLLPLLGFCIASASLIPAYLYARRALTRPQAGSFLAAAFFSNLGYFGAFTAFALFGEAGYALAMLYLVFFTPCFYTLGFWIGASYGHSAAPGRRPTAYGDRLRFIPFLGMLAGALLNLAGVPRPVPLEALNHVLIPVDTALYLLAIGSQVRYVSPRPWLRPCLVMSAIKFLYAPAVAWGLVTLMRLTGLPRAIVLLEAATPVGVSPLMLPLLFGLNRSLASALWLFTTLAAVAWFFLVIPALSRLPLL